MRTALVAIPALLLGLLLGWSAPRWPGPGTIDTTNHPSAGVRIAPNVRSYCDPLNGATLYVYRDGWGVALIAAGGDCRK